MSSQFFLFLVIAAVSSDGGIQDCPKPKHYLKNGIKTELITICSENYRIETEYQSGKQNGLETAYYSNGKIRYVTHYKDDLEEGSTLFWDSLGNTSGKRYHYRGKPVGTHRGWNASGIPTYTTTYDSLGRKHGLDAEWWPDGKKNSELFYAADVCTLAIDYYRNGNKKTLARHPNIPHVEITPQKTSSGESWSWSGKSIAKITRGNGYEIRLPRNFNDTTEPLSGLVGRYKDSLLVEIKKIDSAAVMKYK